ncbi:MAG: hypothetical protein ACRENS_06960, partial [Candidatus Eiseniibacteriota bacterium]
AIASGWALTGNALSAEVIDKINPVVVSDGAGGAIIAWQTGATLGSNNVWSQRVNGAGALQWGVNGAGVSGVANSQYQPSIVSDGAGGAVIVWQDTRNTTFDIYAQRMNSAGVQQWTTDGVPLNPGFHSQVSPASVSDGAGGVMVSWQDTRNGTSDIYAQRLNSSGADVWTPGGVACCITPGTQWYSSITTDRLGGAVVTWQDDRGPDVYAQRVNGAGSALWGSGGVAISTAAAYQQTPIIASNGASGAIITWQDSRSLAGWDVYGQNVNADGSLGGSLLAVPGTSVVSDLAVRGAHNPSMGALSLAFSLPADSPARIEVFDLGGRRVAARDVGALGSGTHVASLESNAREMPAGVYDVRLTQGAHVAFAKVVMLR